MKSLTIKAKELMPGDRLLRTEDQPCVPALVWSTRPDGNWGGEFMYADQGHAMPRLLLSDFTVCVERAESTEELHDVWDELFNEYRSCERNEGAVGAYAWTRRGGRLVRVLYFLEHCVPMADEIETFPRYVAELGDRLREWELTEVHDEVAEEGIIFPYSQDMTCPHDGERLTFRAHYAAPGCGSSYGCAQGHAWARVGGSMHDPASGAHILSPSDVI